VRASSGFKLPRTSRKLELLDRDNVEFIQLDLAKEDAWCSISTGFDQIYHLAAVVGVTKVMAAPVDTLRVNTLSTLHMLEYVRICEQTCK
jgi:UDP-glucose 4-epimerase/UDP-glucuronate decarboxylase